MQQIAYILWMVTALLAALLCYLIPWILVSKRVLAVLIILLTGSTIGWGFAFLYGL